MYYLNKIFTYTKGFRRAYVLSAISVFSATLLSLLNPLIFRYVLDIVIQKFDSSDTFFDKIMFTLVGRNILKVALLMLTLALARGVGLYFRGKLASIASEGIAKVLRDKTYSHLQNVKYSYFNSVQTGDLIQRCTSDIDTIRKFLSVQLVQVVNIALMITIISFVLARLNLKLSIIVLALVPIMFIFSFYFFKAIKKFFKISDEAEAKLSTVLQENIHGVRVVRAFANEGLEIEKFRVANQHYTDVTYKVMKLFAIFWPVTSFFSFLQLGIVYYFGITWAVNGDMTIGTVVAFAMYIAKLKFPIRLLGRVLSDFGKASIAFERIEEILDSESDFDHTLTLEKPEIFGEISFNNICFSYGEQKVLDNISFNLKKGETLGILGPTGSGKSTLIHLLTRLYDYEDGSIKIDGIELKNIDKKWIRENIGLVLQETFLFAKNIEENIAITSDTIRENEIINAAKTASIHNGILHFRDGYKTIVGEKGVSLSGGQKQRIAIARTVINNHKILIFDDSLSAIDVETDANIRRELKRKHGSSTTIIVSHRISSIIDADKIMVLEDGRISDFGSHNQLKNRDGLYKRILEIQETGMDGDFNE